MAKDWLQDTLETTRRRLEAATAPADRLALLREMARLSGGRSAPPSPLTPADEALLGRFALAASTDGAVRILDEDLSDIAPGLDVAMRIDAKPRAGVSPAPPDAVLLRLTPHERYRSRTQKSAIQATLTAPPGAALMVSMPTGAGKSLLFQAPVLSWRESVPGACAIVIVPTVALAEDHERTLRAMPGLDASRALSGSTPTQERQEILAGFRNGDIPILLLSPEAAFGTARQDLMQAALPLTAAEKYGQHGILSAVFIDEAHIIESWGRSFRPDFQRLPALVRELRANNPDLRTILLSATLTPGARAVLRSDYGGGPWGEIHARTPRYQFDLSAAAFSGQAERDTALYRLIDRAPRPAIVYTTRVEQAEELHDGLKLDAGYKRIALFTGAISDAQTRREIVQHWADGALDLVVATSAFGLGVDKADVRAVIHACLPEGAARWYQEIGRASRDGYQGLGVTLWTQNQPGPSPRRRRTDEVDVYDSDEDDAASMAGGGWLSLELAQARWAALLKGATADGRDPSTGALRLILPLDAAREGLDPRYTGERNRGWNRSLLNLLQRQGAIVVEAEAPRGDDIPKHWRVSILNDAILSFDDGPVRTQAWAAVFQGRDQEVSQARAELREFVKAMRRHDSDCLLRSVYRLIEPDAAPQACGRCEACRQQGIEPPHDLRPQVAEFAWPARKNRSALPVGVILIAPEGAPSSLLGRLSQAGVEQVVAPEGEAAQVAQALADQGGRLGFVQSAEHWLRRDGVVPDLPTAFLPPSNASLAPWLREIDRLAKARPHQSLILVANPSARVDGRPLHQVASQYAPYDERALDEFVVAAIGAAT